MQAHSGWGLALKIRWRQLRTGSSPVSGTIFLWFYDKMLGSGDEPDPFAIEKIDSFFNLTRFSVGTIMGVQSVSRGAFR